jgi:WD40 repeat protein
MYPVNKSQNKSTSPMVFIVGVFIAVMILMFIARFRSQNIQRINIPLNNGIVTLLTYNNLLAAISNDNKIYVWEWSSLSKKQREGTLESSEAVLAAPDTILSVKRARPDCLVVSGLDANSESKKIPLSLTSNAASLCATPDGNKIILLLERGEDPRITYELFEVELNLKQVRPIAAIPAEQGRLEHLSVSNDGRYVAAAGEKKEHGWMFVADTKENKIVWQKEFPDFKQLHKGVFSNDGQTIYTRASDSMLTLVKTGTGEIIDRLLPTKENKSTYRNQHAQTVAISGDGGLVAATVFSEVYIWDTKTRKKYDIPGMGQKVLSSMVFSPDGRYIATADLRQGGVVKVARTPRY